MRKFDKDFIQYSDKKVKNETQNLALYLSTRIVFYILLIFFAIFFAWYTVFVSTHNFYAVSGVSMMSTLNNQISHDQMANGEKFSYDAVYVDKLADPRLFDIIVIETNVIDKKTGQNKNIVKRLMAQEGDFITIAKAKDKAGVEHFHFFRIPAGANLSTFTDDMAKLDESGKNGYEIYSYSNWDEGELETGTKSAGGGSHVYENAFFSTFLERTFEGNEYVDLNDGNFHVSANGLVYVKVPKGKFFYMGDNRAHSTDAREHGFCDESRIVGRTEFVVYNYNFGNRLWEVVKFYFSQVEKFFAR